jgi:hypothetical protein
MAFISPLFPAAGPSADEYAKNGLARRRKRSLCQSEDHESFDCPDGAFQGIWKIHANAKKVSATAWETLTRAPFQKI